MAEKDLYLKEAYEELERLSMDEEKRYAYEAREKALRGPHFHDELRHGKRPAGRPRQGIRRRP